MRQAIENKWKRNFNFHFSFVVFCDKETNDGLRIDEEEDALVNLLLQQLITKDSTKKTRNLQLTRKMKI